MIESIAPYLVYVLAVGFPALLVFRWVYSQWWKANLPAFWAWLLQQRRRDKVIRETREQVADLEQRLATLEEKVGGSVTEPKNEESNDITEGLEDVLIRLTKTERLLAQLRHRLRAKGIMLD